MATPRKLTVTDAHLAEALAGRTYLLFDGGMGTLVQAAGLHTVHAVSYTHLAGGAEEPPAGRLPERSGAGSREERS